MASIVSILVRLKLSILVRLENIVYPSPLEAVSILFHMAFVYPRTHPRLDLVVFQCNDDPFRLASCIQTLKDLCSGQFETALLGRPLGYYITFLAEI
jgi:hypothetical protein